MAQSACDFYNYITVEDMIITGLANTPSYIKRQKNKYAVRERGGIPSVISTNRLYGTGVNSDGNK